MIIITVPIIEVQNVVASGEFDQKIDLLHIAASLDRAEYNPESFPGLVLRVSDPKAVFLLFSTGKLVCTFRSYQFLKQNGGKSKEDVYAAIETLVKQLRSIDINVNSPPKVKIQNMVASVTLDFSINLETIALTLENSLYLKKILFSILRGQMSQSSSQDLFTGWPCQRLLSSFLDQENSSVHLVAIGS